MNILPYIILLAALVCFLVDAFVVASPPPAPAWSRVRMTALGLALIVIHWLVALEPKAIR